MRILLTADPIIPVPPAGYGGIERIVDALAREFRRRGHTVGLVAKAGSTCPVDAFFPWPGDNVSGKLDTLRNTFALAKAVREFEPDLVHSYSRLAYLSLIQPTARPKIMSYQRHVSPGQVRPALRLARRDSLTFTGCSEFICAQGRSPGTQWTAIPNFVEIDRIDFQAEVPADAPLLFLSRVESIKGPDVAIAIARRCGRRLLIAGNRATEGPEAEFFEREVAPHLGHDGIEWVGEVGDLEKNRLLGRCAALVVPIRWDEPFGIVFAEALAAGTPVISCARGALPEIIRPGTTGFFVQNAEEGAAAVTRLGSLDRRACRTDAEQRFSLARCADLYLALYQEACGRATAGPSA
ncbi:glycosyltransferase family 4 protein [Oleiharenicola lentus]|uniref:Glycosyltransferase family 4 protein n=1 Tax=Oleiharenicola lentus TaxID=2508720 RepID=A0A4Q1CBQ1_9BACT|nr:glycosyltransferase [Oleiharenicola lentus]RXK56524.1 glycosyltransferase family 4 protein [Oleiharenicola lentus]